VYKRQQQIDSKGGIVAFAATGLKPSSLAELSGAISSLGNGGSVSVKAPTVALDTFNFGGLATQSAALLGNPKIPPLAFGTLNIPAKAITEDQVTKFNEIKAKLAEKEDLQWDLRKSYLDDKQKYGDNASQTAASYDAYKDCLQQIETLRKELSSVRA
jgi:hypothetical protein